MLVRREKYPADFFQDFFNQPFFSRREGGSITTDIKEKDGNYVVTMDVPGVPKESIKVELENGYLNIVATRNEANEEKDDSGRYIRQERYTGSYQRSFYVGNGVNEEDIKAELANGVLELKFPKASKQIEQKKYIAIV